MNPQISVIMPVYNVEAYVGRAIEHMLAQSFRDFEFIIVDDGSRDGSGALVDEYARRDARILVIHQTNAGAFAARNRAMDLARGKYFYFLDADDWAEPQMLEEMHALCERHQLQLAVCGFTIDTYYDERHCVSDRRCQPGQVFESQRQFRENAYRLFDRNLLYTPWNKLYLAEYLNARALRYPATFWDDFPFNVSVLWDVERVGVLETPFYHFIRARAESETAKYRPDMYEKREEEHGWMLKLYQHWQVDDPLSREMVQRRYIERVVGCVENIACPDCTLPLGEKLRQVRAMISSPNARQALREARPQSRTLKLMLLPMRLDSGLLTYLEGMFISQVKRKHVKRFAQLKAER